MTKPTQSHWPGSFSVPWSHDPLRANSSSLVFCAFLIAFSLFPVCSRATVIGGIQVDWRTQSDTVVEERVTEILLDSRGTEFGERQLSRLLRSVLTLLASDGYHTAILEPGDFQLENDSVWFVLAIDPGRRVIIERWELIGLRRIDSSWLAGILELPTGVIGNEAALKEASRAVGGVEIVSLEVPPAIRVQSDTSAVGILQFGERSPARFEGALAAGGDRSNDQSVLGRFSIELSGLFRRGHSLDIRYEHLEPSNRLIGLGYREQSTIIHGLRTQIRLEDWRRNELRQTVGAEAAIELAREPNVALTLAASWQKVAPLEVSIEPSRLYDLSAGFHVGSDATNVGAAVTHSTHGVWNEGSNDSESRSRWRFDGNARVGLEIIQRFEASASVRGRWWSQRSGTRLGDEWFLGGAELSGYATRSLAAIDGIWGRLEARRLSRSGLGAGVFGDLAWLTMFNGRYERPATLGVAVLLHSAGRSGRLELAWRDRASFGDGILRLTVEQGW